jgi:hypothetical protein
MASHSRATRAAKQATLSTRNRVFAFSLSLSDRQRCFTQCFLVDFA